VNLTFAPLKAPGGNANVKFKTPLETYIC
jgi:hypothetical protein